MAWVSSSRKSSENINVYVVSVNALNFLGAILPLAFVWNFGDIALSLMTIPNLIAVILLTGTLKKLTNDYFSRKHLTLQEKLLAKQ